MQVLPNCFHRPLLFASLLLSVQLHGQVPVSRDSIEADASAEFRELMALLESTKAPESYFQVSATVGNRLFSLHNNKLNANQSASTTVYNPSLGYYHRSGLSLAAGAYLLNDPAKGFGMQQYSVTPGFQMQGKNLNLGISYTRYFVKDKFSPYSSPIQNDLYAAVSLVKPWIQPGIALGYSTGEYGQYHRRDTIINAIPRMFYDSATHQLEAFALLVSASHQFVWYGLMGKSDGLLFSPALLLNCGSSSQVTTHKTNAPNLLQFLLRRNRVKREISSDFRAESLGMNLDCVYSIGNLSINPQWYVDYYLPETTEQRLSQVFALSLNFSF